MTTFRAILIAIGITLIFSACTPEKTETFTACQDFYTLNKGKSFGKLFDVAIGVRRNRFEYDDSIGRKVLAFKSIEVFDSKKNDFFMLPVYPRGGSSGEKVSAFSKIEPTVMASLCDRLNNPIDPVLFLSYLDFVDAVYAQYDSIVTPDSYHAKNVITEGVPRFGKFIAFTLFDDATVYYVADIQTATDHWKDYFAKCYRFDKNWYCNVRPED